MIDEPGLGLSELFRRHSFTEQSTRMRSVIPNPIQLVHNHHQQIMSSSQFPPFVPPSSDFSTPTLGFNSTSTVTPPTTATADDELSLKTVTRRLTEKRRQELTEIVAKRPSRTAKTAAIDSQKASVEQQQQLSDDEHRAEITMPPVASMSCTKKRKGDTADWWSESFENCKGSKEAKGAITSVPRPSQLLLGEDDIENRTLDEVTATPERHCRDPTNAVITPTCTAKRRKKGAKSRKEAVSNFRSNSWLPCGQPSPSLVYLGNAVKPVRRECFGSIEHRRYRDQLLTVGDCALIASDHNYQHVGHIAKLCGFHIDADTRVLIATVLWYYKHDQLQLDFPLRNPCPQQELFASRHVDTVPVDAIEDIAYVLTYNEYNRFVAENTMDSCSYPPAQTLLERGSDSYPRRCRMPRDDTPAELVYFCRRVYDFHGKKLVRSPM